MLNLNDFAKEVHANAVAHGWWDGERSDAEVIALIHSEWSEALEEYRAGRPMVYCCNPDCEILRSRETNVHVCADVCGFRGRTAKPEGVAVELIDGCIRILDFLAQRGDESESLFDCLMMTPLDEDTAGLDVPSLCTRLHTETVWSHDEYGRVLDSGYGVLIDVVSIVFRWLRIHGVDPEAVMIEKHRYNKTRPHKHGGKVC